MNLKGSLPLLILRILFDEPSHGYHIARRIKDESEGVLDFREGTLYPTLHNLEKDGLIEARTAVKNGRKRRYYNLTDAGHHALAEQQAEWQSFAQAVNKILGKGQA